MGKMSNVCISLNQNELLPKLGGSEKRERSFPRYLRKQSDLAQSDEMSKVSMLLIIKFLIVGQKIVLRKKKGRFFGIKAGMLLKTHVEKMSHFCLSTISMKINGLWVSFHDVIESKGS